MIIIVLILSILNFIGLLTAGVIYFKEKCTIVPIEEWNRIAKVYNVAVTAGLVTEDGELTPPIAPDNVGFFKEQVDEDFYEEEEEEEEDKRKKSKKNGKH